MMWEICEESGVFVLSLFPCESVRVWEVEWGGDEGCGG